MQIFILLQVHSTFFGFPPQPSSGVLKIVNTASGPDLDTLEGSSFTDIMTSTGGCGYSF